MLCNGLVPFYLNWGTDTPEYHPSNIGKEFGLELVGLECQTDDREKVARLHRNLGVEGLTKVSDLR